MQSLRHELETAQKENAELKASLEGAERRARASMNAAADDACASLLRPAAGSSPHREAPCRTATLPRVVVALRRAEEYTQHRKTRRKLREWQERAEEAETQLAELRERHAHLQSTHVAKTRDLATRLDQAYSRHAAVRKAPPQQQRRVAGSQRPPLPPSPLTLLCPSSLPPPAAACAGSARGGGGARPRALPAAARGGGGVAGGRNSPGTQRAAG